MKKYYTISEVKQLYGFGLDSLRYYEKIGLLHPQRRPNGYRVYDVDNIYKLNIIKDLRELGLPFSKIKDFLDTRSVCSSISYLNEESLIIDEKIKLLENKKKSLLSKIDYISFYSSIPSYSFLIEPKKRRNCLCLLTDIPFGRGLDLLFNQVTDLDDNYLSLIGNDTYGGELSPDRSTYQKVFLLSSKIKHPTDSLKEGEYASLIYRGDYSRRKQAMDRFLSSISKEDYVAKGPLLELFHIDNHETKNPDEYVSEFTMMVEKKRNR